MVTDRVTLKNTARFSTGSVSHVLRAGLDWSERKQDTWGRANPRNLSAPMLPGYGYNPAGTDRRLAVFAVNNMDFGNDLRASIGGRIEQQKIAGGKSGGAVQYGPYSNTARTIGAGVEKGFGSGVTGFASYTWGETPASLDTFSFTSPSRGGQVYGDGVQNSRNWELGLKYAGGDVLAAGDRLTGSVSYYDTTIRNALFGPASGGTSEYAGFKMRGFELAAQYDTASGLYARAALSTADHKERSVSATADVWRDYTYNPGTQGSLTLGHKWDNGWDVAWTLSGGKGFTLVQGATRTEKAGWGVSDLSVRYTPAAGVLAGMTVDFAIENVFDKTYKQPMAYLNEPGRNVKLTLAKTF